MNARFKKIPIRVVHEEPQQDDLYEVRRKIYPRAVSGLYARWRVALVLLTQLVFYGLPWLPWHGRQAVLFDLAARKFYIFGMVFWPQDFIYLAILLVISALSLFLFTAVAGRVWCGYACPQTVYTEIFLWIERKIEGDRLKQMKLDAEPMSARKLFLKSAKHGAWIALSLYTGFTFVGYFTPVQTLAAEIGHLTIGPWEGFWVLFYGFATYGNAGWMREQVCKYMCPYARFQSVMFDRDTMVITYDAQRGEPRGARRRSADPAALGLGECVDCNICVQVCPVGIDIRDGLQYECIGCAACIDGCNQVMDKMGYERGLIRYATENGMQAGMDTRQMASRIFRPRVLVYSAVLWAVILGTGYTMFTHVPLKVDIIRDRASLARTASDGEVENVYRLQIMNTDEKPHRYTITATGMPQLALRSEDTLPVEIAGGGTRQVPVLLRAPRPAGQRHNIPVELHVQAVDNPRITVKEPSSFLLPLH